MDEFTVDEAHLQILLKQIDEVVVVLDSEGRVTWAGPGVGQLLGVDAGSLVGTQFDSLAVSPVPGLSDGPAPAGRLSLRRVGRPPVEAEVEVAPLVKASALGAAVVTLRPLEATDPEGELWQRLAREERLTAIARSFVRLDPDRFNRGVVAALASVGDVDGIDRASVWQLTPGGEALAVSHEWLGEGVSSTDVAARIPLVGTRLLESVKNLEDVRIDDPDDLGDDWSFERNLLHRRGSRSMLALPLVSDGMFVGLVTFDRVLSADAIALEQVGTLRTVAGILAEVLARHGAEQALTHQARIDRLTGLPNRWAVVEHLDAAVERLADDSRERRGLGVLLIDLDRFASLNDLLGSSAGDAILTAIGHRLAAARPPGCHLGRFGGDELVVVTENAPDAVSVQGVARELSMVLEAPFSLDGHEVEVTCSIGIVFATDSALDGAELLRRADSAMYLAKARGRHRIELFDEHQLDAASRRLEREARLRAGIEGGEISVDLLEEVSGDGQVRAVVAVPVWRSDSDSLRGGQLIDLAEEVHLGEELWAAMLSVALHTWTEPGTTHVRLHLPVWAAVLRSGGAVAQLRSAAGELGSTLHRLVLDVSESDLFELPTSTRGLWDEASDAGASVAVTGMGVGPCSSLRLDELREVGLHVTALVLDASLVRSPHVAHLVSLLAADGSDVVADGVDDTDLASSLLAIGCAGVRRSLVGQ